MRTLVTAFIGVVFTLPVFGIDDNLAELLKKAEQGDANAQHELGHMYHNGEGVAEDKVEAVKWYRKAAEQGHADGQYALGWMYDNGEGVAEDDVEAVKWYRKAAEQGHADAQYNLGWIYKEEALALGYILLALAASVIMVSKLEKGLKQRQPDAQPYAWGFFNGCMGLCTALLAVLCALAGIGFALDGDSESSGAMMALATYLSLHAICGWFIIKRKRWPFVISTVFDCNILRWIINGIYIRNRWDELGGEGCQPNTEVNRGRPPN